jgi:hypothetical protein
VRPARTHDASESSTHSTAKVAGGIGPIAEPNSPRRSGLSSVAPVPGLSRAPGRVSQNVPFYETNP